MRERWLPVIEAMAHPMFITLTIVNGPDLAERVSVLAASFDRLLDLRLGPRNWPKYRDAAIEFLVCHLADTDSDPASRRDRLLTTTKSLDWFGDRIEKYHELTDEWPRFRDILGRGLSTLEITYNPGTSWHCHRHLVNDCGFIPWPLLRVLWQSASKGQGLVVDIRRVDKGSNAVAEVIKYVTKPWEIPSDKADELRRVTFGRKHVWPLGGAAPVKVEHTCPGCGKPTSECRVIDVGVADTVATGINGDGVEWSWVQMRRTGDRVLLLKQGGRWLRSQDINLIPMPFACQPAVPGGPSP